jgi:hypothetical protein
VPHQAPENCLVTAIHSATGSVSFHHIHCPSSSRTLKTPDIHAPYIGGISENRSMSTNDVGFQRIAVYCCNRLMEASVPVAI